MGRGRDGALHHREKPKNHGFPLFVKFVFLCNFATEIIQECIMNQDIEKNRLENISAILCNSFPHSDKKASEWGLLLQTSNQCVYFLTVGTETRMTKAVKKAESHIFLG